MSSETFADLLDRYRRKMHNIETRDAERIGLFRCPECGEKDEFDVDVAPDNPTCGYCWNGSFEETPDMELVEIRDKEGERSE